MSGKYAPGLQEWKSEGKRTEAKLFVFTGPDCCSGLASEEQRLRRKQPLLKAWSWLQGEGPGRKFQLCAVLHNFIHQMVGVSHCCLLSKEVHQGILLLQGPHSHLLSSTGSMVLCISDLAPFIYSSGRVGLRPCFAAHTSH